MRRVRVLIVDDHELVRTGMAGLLRQAPWVAACAGARAPEDALALGADVALVDVQLGLRVCLELRRRARVALLSSRWDSVPPRTVREAGALGVVAKEAPARALALAVRDLAGGREVDVPCPRPAAVRLHPTDRQILRLAAAGLTSAEIGARLHLARGTVKLHLRELLARLGVANRAAAVHLARRLGAIEAAVEPLPPASGAPPRPVRVLVAEAADTTRAGAIAALRREPWVAGCHGAGGREEALRLAARVRPDVALVDGVALSRELAAPGLRTLLLRDNGTGAAGALCRAGAAGVVLRSWPAARVSGAVRAACAPSGPARRAAGARVSARERDVLCALVSGATNGEIAERLGLSPHTVKQHTSSIYRKLGVRNRAQAAAAAELLVA